MFFIGATLELSALVDTVDHCILARRLRAYLWNSFRVIPLSERAFLVTVNNYAPSAESLSCGVPQGSILGPLLSALFPIVSIITHFLLSLFCRQYAIIYFILNLKMLQNCSTDHFLQLNTDKPVDSSLYPEGDKKSWISFVKPTLPNQGVSRGQVLSLEQNVKGLVCSCFYQYFVCLFSCKVLYNFTSFGIYKSLNWKTLRKKKKSSLVGLLTVHITAINYDMGVTGRHCFILSKQKSKG